MSIKQRMSFDPDGSMGEELKERNLSEKEKKKEKTGFKGIFWFFVAILFWMLLPFLIVFLLLSMVVKKDKDEEKMKKDKKNINVIDSF